MLPIRELYSDIYIAWSTSPSFEKVIVKTVKMYVKHVIHVCKAIVMLDSKEKFIHALSNNDACIG